jgi:hypothetical protein
MSRMARRPPQRAAPRGTATRMPCRHASHSAAGQAPRRQPLWAAPRPRIPEIHPPAQAPPPAADRNASPRCPPGTLGSRQTRHSRPWASARLSAAREAGMGTPRTMSVAVRGKADGAHRPSARHGRVRYTSVDTATQRSTALQGDTRRDKKKTARRAAFPQQAGRFRRWWQVLGSNQGRLSRRFYRPLPLATRATCRAVRAGRHRKNSPRGGETVNRRQLQVRRV